MIALEVLGKDSDSTIDSLGRVEGRRLRAKLGLLINFGCTRGSRGW